MEIEKAKQNVINLFKLLGLTFKKTKKKPKIVDIPAILEISKGIIICNKITYITILLF